MKKRFVKLLFFAVLAVWLGLYAAYHGDPDLRWFVVIFSWFTGAVFGYYAFKWRLERQSYFSTWKKWKEMKTRAFCASSRKDNKR